MPETTDTPPASVRANEPAPEPQEPGPAGPGLVAPELVAPELVGPGPAAGKAARPGGGLLGEAVRGVRGTLITAVVLRSGHQAFEALVPVLVGVVVDRAIDGGSGRTLAGWLAVLAVDFLALSLCFRFGSRATVAATERATAIALGVFVIHLLGDALSPPLIGVLSDRFSLAQAVKIVPIAVLIGGCIWIWAARAQPLNHAPRAA